MTSLAWTIIWVLALLNTAIVLPTIIFDRNWRSWDELLSFFAAPILWAIIIVFWFN